MAADLAAFDRLADALDTLPLVVRQSLVGLVQSATQQLLNFNREYLQKLGERPDGATIQPQGYSTAYAAYRRKYGKQTAYVDLDFTGEYVKAFALDYVGGLTFEVQNNDPKVALLAKKYGELLGVRAADLEEFIRTVLEPQVREVITQHMTLV